MGILYDYTRLAGTSKWVFCMITRNWLVQVTGILYDYTRLAGTSKWVFCTITLDWLVQVNGYSVQLH